MKSVRLSDKAEAELEEIGDFIAEDNPSRADSFVAELLERCFALAAHAERYPIVAVVTGVEMRRCVFSKYLIFYSVRGNAVEIAHIFHSARDYMRLLFPD